MTEYLAAVLAAALVNQAFVSRFCAAPPEDPVRDAAQNGAAVVLVLTAASALAYVLRALVLEPLGLASLQTFLLLLLIAAVVWLLGVLLRDSAPGAYAALEPSLRCTVANCAVLGGVLSVLDTGAGFASGVLTCFGVSVVYALCSVVFAGILAQIDESDLPAPVRGAPVVLLCAALVSMALLSLPGLSF